MNKVENAVIMAAGTSSRFAPLSYEKPKPLIEVKNEILIERQIRQLQAAGIHKIYIVTGYKAEQFQYLKDKFGVALLYNPEYYTRNNNGSIWAAKDVICNTYICSGDNYFSENPFSHMEPSAYYSAVYSPGPTNEWCIKTDAAGTICSVQIGGKDSWYMLGHAFWDADFSATFLSILEKEYKLPKTADMLWEAIYIRHISELPMSIKQYPDGVIHEFDTLDELRAFDPSYRDDTKSKILKSVAEALLVPESDLREITAIKGNNRLAAGFSFTCNGRNFLYDYASRKLWEDI